MLKVFKKKKKFKAKLKLDFNYKQTVFPYLRYCFSPLSLNSHQHILLHLYPILPCWYYNSITEHSPGPKFSMAISKLLKVSVAVAEFKPLSQKLNKIDRN